MQLLLKTDRVVINFADENAEGAFDAYSDLIVVNSNATVPSDYRPGKYLFTNEWVKNPNYTEG
jgi:hypothetical protein